MKIKKKKLSRRISGRDIIIKYVSGNRLQTRRLAGRSKTRKCENTEAQNEYLKGLLMPNI
jgi:hypothetical protein